MNKVYLGTLRDIWFNKTRSFVVILSLIMVVAFPISFLNVAPNLTTVIENEEDDFHLAHFNIFFDDFYDDSVSENVSTYISDYLDINQNQVKVEPRVFQSSKTRSNGGGTIEPGTWIDLDVMVFDADNPYYVSSLKLTRGSYPHESDEISILESLAEADNIEIGDTIKLYDRGGIKEFEVVGFVKSIEYSAYELSQTGAAFLSLEGMEELTEIPNLDNVANQIAIYFEYDISLGTLKEVSEVIKERLVADGINIALFWFVRETSFRRALLDALTLTSQYMIAASIFIFLVAGVVIFVVTNRYVTEQKTRIGALYSFGVKRWKIMKSFFLRVFVLSVFSIALGLLLSKLLLSIIISTLVEQWGLIGYSNTISQDSIIFTLISASIVAYTFTFLAVFNLIRMTPYEAMRGKTSELKNRGILFKISNLLPTKILRGAAKNLTRNRTRTFLTVVAFTIALTFSGSLIITDTSMDYTIDDFYTNTVDYDMEVDIGYNKIIEPNSNVTDDILNAEEVTRGEYFINSLIQLSDHPEILTYLIGLQRNTTMYDLTESNILEGRWHQKNTSEIVVSRYIQGSEGIEMNSELSFDFFGIQFNGTVVGVSNDIQYNSAIFVDFDYLNRIIYDRIYQHLPKSTIIANKLLLQLDENIDIKEFQDQLNIENEDVNIAITKDSYRRRSIALAESQTAIIYLMVFLGLVVGSVSVFTTLLIAVVERERELALLRVFGYKKRELLVQILLEGWFIGIIALIPTFFLARFIADVLWIKIVSDNIYEVIPFYSPLTDLFLVIFAIVSITISLLPAFRSAVANKISEVIREE